MFDHMTSNMASRLGASGPMTRTMDIVCETLQVKLLNEDISCGSSPCIQLGSRTISLCQFQREAGKASAKNWRATISYLDQSLSRFLETYTNQSSKRYCCFVAPVNDLNYSPPPTSSYMVRSSRTLSPTSFESLYPPDLSTHPTTLESIHPPLLLVFPPAAKPNFTWGVKDSPSFCNDLNTAYKEVTQWRRNVFDTPRGSAGKAFMCELARLFCSVGQGSELFSRLCLWPAHYCYSILILVLNQWIMQSC